MTETPTLDEAAVSEIEARRARCLDNKNQSRLAEASILISSDIPALCATVKHLRAEVRGIRRGFPEWAAEWDALQSQLEQLRAERELERTSCKAANELIVKLDNFRSRAIQLCKDKAAEWAKQSEEAQGRGIQVVADGKASRALAAKELAAELEKL